ncbi:MAG: hypothetical protein ONB07_09260 [candidate division KSB1 bacterium]|nr:hypothetical protein [candidate division KSB1 bacterium]MDZ7391489.1 hypothetical protein [candidate division KSB1 bacterium]MDZ7412901.1 hypothetical protein [candidate division KSB1 bacterium]
MDSPKKGLLSYLPLLTVWSLLWVATDWGWAQAQKPRTINVFIDCPDYFCDQEFFRTELNYVNHVRDRKDADVHVLITSQETGGGGTEFTLNFIGLRTFAGREDTLRYVAGQRATEDEIRRGLVRHMRIGLIPYLMHTEAAERLAVSYTAPPDTAAKKVVDPWKYWTFSLYLRGYSSGEKSYKNHYLSTSLSANKTTDAWKVRLSVTDYYSESRYEIGDDYTVVNIQRGGGARAMVVRSIDDHLSIGGRASAWWSTYDNIDLGLRVAPAVEFDFFPYSQSTHRQLTFQYGLGAQKCRYHEETIFLKTAENLFDQSLTAAYVIKRPWGSVSSSLEAANYLHDARKYHLELSASLEVRVFKGLRFTTGGYVTFLRDQLSLPRRGASLEEVLLRQRQLETSYNYFVSFGISYTFGSIYSTVVNPRFETPGIIFRM